MSELFEFSDSGYWDELWGSVDEDSVHGDGTDLFLTILEDLLPGHALDMGCGDGRNAILIAERGWRVTAVDFSKNALASGRRKALESSVTVEFVLADAGAFVPAGPYDLITSFYIQLPPEARAAMLTNLCDALEPGGRLVFVSHDCSTPPQGWSETEKLTLTSVDTVVSELHGVEIELALVLEAGEMTNNSEKGHKDHQSLNSTVIVARARVPGQHIS